MGARRRSQQAWRAVNPIIPRRRRRPDAFILRSVWLWHQISGEASRPSRPLSWSCCLWSGFWSGRGLVRPSGCTDTMADISQPINVRSAVPQRAHDLARPFRRSVDFSNRQVATLFIVLAAITSIPIVLYPWPPLADYINHLARMHVIAAIDSDPDLARFYQINWQIIPNLMMDLVVPALQQVMNVYLAGQIYTIASFVLILSGTLALNRQLYGHWSVLPMIAFPLLYNNVFLVGTMNYVFGIGLALWALAAWIWLRERGMLLRLAV